MTTEPDQRKLYAALRASLVASLNIAALIKDGDAIDRIQSDIARLVEAADILAKRQQPEPARPA